MGFNLRFPTQGSQPCTPAPLPNLPNLAVVAVKFVIVNISQLPLKAPVATLKYYAQLLLASGGQLVS